VLSFCWFGKTTKVDIYRKPWRERERVDGGACISEKKKIRRGGGEVVVA
jgi:hypothetical protein